MMFHMEIYGKSIVFFGGRLWDINCFLNGKLLGTHLGRL